MPTCFLLTLREGVVWDLPLSPLWHLPICPLRVVPEQAGYAVAGPSAGWERSGHGDTCLTAGLRPQLPGAPNHEVLPAGVVPLRGLPAGVHHVTAVHLLPPQHGHPALPGLGHPGRDPPGEAGARLHRPSAPQQGGARRQELCLSPLHGRRRRL